MINYAKYVKTITINSLQEALDVGCDCVMFKHAGTPVRVDCYGKEVKVVTSYEGTPEVETFSSISDVTALFIGTRRRHNDDFTIFIHDCWSYETRSLTSLTYRERYQILRKNLSLVDSRLFITEVWPINHAQECWRVVSNGGYPTYNGLVFRRSKDQALGELYVRRFYPEFPQAL